MLEQEIILLIMNCKKYEKKALFQKQTWLKTIPPFLKYYHVIGDPLLETEYKFDNENNILWVKVDDDYNSLPNKVITSYNAIYETFQFKYILKTDDDHGSGDGKGNSGAVNQPGEQIAPNVVRAKDMRPR